MSFTIEAEDADVIDGWSEFESQLGEGTVLLWDEEGPAYVAWNIEIPCEDTWHVWVRATDYKWEDTFYVRIDDEPQDWAIFELACDNGPNDTEYKWNELNWRDLDAPECTYEIDPWTQEWDQGIHSLALGYRDSVAISKIWLTNTDVSPPD